MRMNNLSARLTVNQFLLEKGYSTLSSSLSYEEFANELRKITAKKVITVSFTERSDACLYIRNVAKGIIKIP